jgi:mRNA interferase MazF
MASIKRGDVFLVNFDPTVGAEATKNRLAVVVSNDINNAHLPIVSIRGRWTKSGSSRNLAVCLKAS